LLDYKLGTKDRLLCVWNRKRKALEKAQGIMTPLLIRLAPELLAKLRALADEKQVSVACIIRSILEDWFNKNGGNNERQNASNG
jgi:hypothetical protein